MQKKREVLYLFIFLLACVFVFAGYYEFHRRKIDFLSEYQIRDGILDLSDIISYNNKVFIVEGESEFFWEKLLSPNDFENNNKPTPDGHIHIPGIWNSFEKDGKKIGGMGFATYRFTIKVNSDDWYGLRFKEFDSAYKVWANGEFSTGSGEIGRTKLTYQPSWKRNELVVRSKDQKIDIVLQIANFDHRKGGAEDPIYFGTTDNILDLKKNNIINSSFLLGFLLMLSIYHFFLYLFRRKDISMILFSALSFFMALRMMSTGEKIILDLFPEISFYTAIRIEYISYQVALPLMYWFFYSFYKQLISKTIFRILNYIVIIFCLIVLLAPIHIFTWTPMFFQVVATLVALYMLYKLSHASFKQYNYALIFLIGYIVFFATMINDILYYNKFINTTFLMHWGLFIMALSQSIVLSLKFSTAINTNEKLTAKLELHNTYLEETIEERTKQIIEQKEEIEAQAEELKAANTHLVELTNFKESLTQMIIHDLKNPLNIILNFSKDERVVFAGTQMLNLVQNLLDVQRYENNKMELRLEKISIDTIIKNATSQLQYLIQEKNITTKVAVNPNYKIEADSDILIRVFVNLLSNAIKFTPNNGIIRIECNKQGQQIVTSISDSGPGIPEDQKELVFEKFGQFLVRRMGKSGSTGIGLTFCKMAVEAHNGIIDFESKLGKGTTFIVKLKTINEPATIETTKQEHYANPENIAFSDEEKKILAEVIKMLANTKIYEISKVKHLISKIDPAQSKNIELWIISVKKAILTGNQQRFEQLLAIAK